MTGLKKIFYRLFNRRNLFFIIFFLILVLGLAIRIVNIKQNDFVFGYDEVEDLIHVKRIAVNHDFVVIGKTIYNNLNLRHGVLSYYFMVPGFLLFSQNPHGVAFWNAFVGLTAVMAVYFLGKSIFKDTKLSLIAAVLYTFSYLAVEYSGWVSHPTFAPLFTLLFFLGLWKMFEKKKWGLLLNLVFLGLSIQSDLIFIYLIPIFIIFLIIYRPKLSGFKTIIVSLLAFTFSLSTILYTEIKFNFSGVKTILNFSGSFDEGRISFFERIEPFLGKFLQTISYSITSENKGIGILIGILIILLIFFSFLKSKKNDKYKIFFLILYLFSPGITLLLGFHDKPWAFLGILPAISLAIAFVIVKLKSNVLVIPAVLFILLLNIRGILTKKITSSLFPSLPESSYFSSQLGVVDYTYKSSNGKDFSIDAVTYPLYVNTYWSYHYPWYGLKKYGYEPTWFGSNQIYPHDSLKKAGGQEEFLYLIIDNTLDIPAWAKDEAVRTSNIKSRVLEEKKIGGFIVQKRKLILR